MQWKNSVHMEFLYCRVQSVQIQSVKYSGPPTLLHTEYMNIYVHHASI